MAGLKFGAFLAPHHPIGENPVLQFRSDLELVEQLDQLGYEEFWCGEHHSTGWEMIASPEMFLAAAGERTHRIKLGTGVVSLPYHHPFIVAQRIVQLDHMTNGRAIFGSGPGALPSDAYVMGIDPMTQRDRQDEAIGIIKRLLQGEERITHESEWFTLNDAKLQLLPVQEDLPFAVASMISPSGMTLAGKYGTGVLSIGSMSSDGLNALPTQWSFAEDSARKHGNVVDRKNWRIVMMWHIAETREQAIAEAREGLFRWHNEYSVGTLMRPGLQPFDDPDQGIEQTGFADLLDLVRSGKAYVKISGAYRASTRGPDYADVIPFAQALIAANPDRIVWGTDWPHPDSSPHPELKVTDVRPFYAIDDGRLMNQLPVWAPDATIRKKILVDNPARLYGL